MAEFGTGIAAAIGSLVALMLIVVSIGLWIIFHKEYKVSYWNSTVLVAAALLLGSPLAMAPFWLALVLTGQASNEVLLRAFSVLWVVMLIWEIALLGIVYGMGAIVMRKRRRRPSNTPGLPDGVDVARLLVTPDDAKQLEEMTRRKMLPM